MSHVLVVWTLCLATAGTNWLKSGDATSQGTWIANGPAEFFTLDHDLGAAAKGSLSISKKEDPQRAAHSWAQNVELPAKGAPKRLALSAQVRAARFAAGTEACVMVQMWPEKGNALGYAWCDRAVRDGDWRATRCVFDVPAGTHTLSVLAYLSGAGQVWFDDFVLEETNDPVTPPPQPGAPRDTEVDGLARGCAADLPWNFDGDAARERAAKEHKPVLIYVRCTDDDKHLESARTTIEAKDIRMQEDGYAKDLLFRAGPLSSPEIRDLVARRTVPLCATYRLATSPSDEERLAGFDLLPREVTTPALVLASAKGKVLAKLHRIGTLSDDLVDHWLRTVLADNASKSDAKDPLELYRDGELERALAALPPSGKPEQVVLRAKTLLRLARPDEARKTLGTSKAPPAEAVRGWIDLRGGAWESAREHFDSARKGLDGEERDEAAFWSAWCSAMLGHHADALAAWNAMLGDSVAGRRAAACAIAEGPRPFLASSTRAWPRTKELPEQTEGAQAGAFDLARSTTALLELQRDDGSFGDHQGLEGGGYCDPAITAIAIQAFDRIGAKLPKDLAARAKASRERALAFLKSYAAEERPEFRAMDPFNLAYATHALLAAGERAPVEQLVARMAKLQLPDGNWTVYNPERPASFNTALCVLALEAAKDAKLELPKDVLERGLGALDTMRRSNGLFPYSTAAGHEWMTTDHGSIARDPLCEHALLACGRGSKDSLAKALQRFLDHHAELRAPTKRLYDYFDDRGHGGYYFFFAHRNALEASRAFASKDLTKKIEAATRDATLAAQEGDGTWMDKFLLGRAYGTAMALLILD